MECPECGGDMENKGEYKMETTLGTKRVEKFYCPQCQMHHHELHEYVQLSKLEQRINEKNDSE